MTTAHLPRKDWLCSIEWDEEGKLHIKLRDEEEVVFASKTAAKIWFEKNRHVISQLGHCGWDQPNQLVNHLWSLIHSENFPQP